MTKLRTPGAFSLMLPQGRKACSVGKPGLIAAALLLVLTLGFAGVCPSVQGQTLNVLYSFGGFASDGSLPVGTLVRDTAGNLYGITFYGGYFNGGCAETGCGILYKLDTTGKLTFLHTFVDKGDGNNPSSLIGDAAGNLAGTTQYTLFRANAAGKFNSIDPFQSASDGTETNSVILDAQGNRYGTSLAGGDLNCNTGGGGCGNVFKLDNGKLTVLHDFTGPPDGTYPNGVIRDAVGNLYGTTKSGGNTACQIAGASGCGIVFKVDSTGHETVLYSFTGGADGAQPGNFFSGAPLVRDAAGNLYGTTPYGGDLSCFRFGCGVVFKLDTTGKETVLHTFTGQPDGAGPNAGLVWDSKGNLYGTTGEGGQYNAGTIFKLDNKGNLTVLHNFGAFASDGKYPSTGLIRDAAGNLYGGTSGGGLFGGTVFELTGLSGSSK
ncbi:MAG TPA: choice-of-anchor tandem repeat GloVer-containing protein [Candidatus Dormibacteraeota bacterium]|jgi:uncharacterized repeat protein (TIGR03803 family)|nr:choice-of-anchor tandem repeat GloVer-containing protein [Candidatus Dormibacteraeota bacterium]